MKTKLTLFVAVIAVALFGMGCASTQPAFVSDGLVAYFPFNGNAKDESGNKNDGTVNGAVLRTDRHGASNKAYQFDGLDDYINIPNHASLEVPTGGLTISAWIYKKGGEQALQSWRKATDLRTITTILSMQTRIIALRMHG